MSDGSELRFTVDQVAAANTAMRVAAGKPPEHFTLERFVSMLAQEMADLRAAGWPDGEIATLIREATGEPVEADMLGTADAAPRG